MQSCATCTESLPPGAKSCASCGQPVSTPPGSAAVIEDPWGDGNPLPVTARPPPVPRTESSLSTPKKGIPTWAKILTGVLILLVVIGTAGVFAARRLLDGFGEAAIEAIEDSSDGQFSVTVNGETITGDPVLVDGALDGLAVGDCVAEGIAVPCDQPHEYEIYHLVSAASPDYPDFSAVFDVSAGECTDVFETYVGIDYFESDFFLDAFPPSEAAWANGDKMIRCALYDPFDDVVGSVRGTAR